jgi:hypothetical protein
VTIRADGQGIEDQLPGTTIHVDKYSQAVLTDIIVFPGETVLNPPREIVEAARPRRRAISCME